MSLYSFSVTTTIKTAVGNLRLEGDSSGVQLTLDDGGDGQEINLTHEQIRELNTFSSTCEQVQVVVED